MSLRNIPPEQLLIFNFDAKDLTWGQGLRDFRTEFRSDGTVSAKSALFIPEFTAYDGFLESQDFLVRVRQTNPLKKYFVIDTVYFLLQDFLCDTDQGKDKFRTFDDLGKMVQALVTEWSEIIGPGRHLILTNHFEDSVENGVTYHRFAVPQGKMVRDQVRPEGRMDSVIEMEKLPGDPPKHMYRIKTRPGNVDNVRVFDGMFPANVTHIEADMKAYLDTYEMLKYGGVFDPGTGGLIVPEAKAPTAPETPAAPETPTA